MYDLSTSAENYLEVIHHLSGSSGRVKNIDIAEKMKVSKASVNRAINLLAEKGYVSHMPYSFITLTEEGNRMALNIIMRHTTLMTFLMDILGVPEEIAEEEACAMEHILSLDTIAKIKKHTDQLKKKK